MRVLRGGSHLPGAGTGRYLRPGTAGYASANGEPTVADTSGQVRLGMQCDIPEARVQVTMLDKKATKRNATKQTKKYTRFSMFC